jgi:hypothetical protein
MTRTIAVVVALTLAAIPLTSCKDRRHQIEVENAPRFHPRIPTEPVVTEFVATTTTEPSMSGGATISQEETPAP